MNGIAPCGSDEAAFMEIVTDHFGMVRFLRCEACCD